MSDTDSLMAPNQTLLSLLVDTDVGDVELLVVQHEPECVFGLVVVEQALDVLEAKKLDVALFGIHQLLGADVLE